MEITLPFRDFIDILLRCGLLPKATVSLQLGRLIQSTDPAEQIVHVEFSEKVAEVWIKLDWETDRASYLKKKAAQDHRVRKWDLRKVLEDQLAKHYFSQSPALTTKLADTAIMVRDKKKITETLGIELTLTQEELDFLGT